jgi:hypothetical protein
MAPVSEDGRVARLLEVARWLEDADDEDLLPAP